MVHICHGLHSNEGISDEAVPLLTICRLGRTIVVQNCVYLSQILTEIQVIKLVARVQNYHRLHSKTAAWWNAVTRLYIFRRSRTLIVQNCIRLSQILTEISAI